MSDPTLITRAQKLDHLAEIMNSAGKEALSFYCDMNGRIVDAKSPGDFVSDADRALEVRLQTLFASYFPGISVVGEEFGGTEGEKYWVVDPIDGTSNFLSGLPFWAISAGLVEDGEPTVGAVFAPALGIMVVGANDLGIRVHGLSAGSSPATPRSFGIGRNRIWDQRDRRNIETQLERAGFNLVTLGSCSLSLLFVACGRSAGYVEKNVAGIWDCAGGVAICRANNVHASFSKNEDRTVDVMAGWFSKAKLSSLTPIEDSMS